QVRRFYWMYSLALSQLSQFLTPSFGSYSPPLFFLALSPSVTTVQQWLSVFSYKAKRRTDEVCKIARGIVATGEHLTTGPSDHSASPDLDAANLASKVSHLSPHTLPPAGYALRHQFVAEWVDAAEVNRGPVVVLDADLEPIYARQVRCYRPASFDACILISIH